MIYRDELFLFFGIYFFCGNVCAMGVGEGKSIELVPDYFMLLHDATSYGDYDAAKQLLDQLDFEARRALVNQEKEGRAPFWLAALRGNLALVQLFKDSGADLNKPDFQGRTPLHVAAGCSANIDVVRELIRAGANVDAVDVQGRTALHAVSVGAELVNEDKEARFGSISQILLDAGLNMRTLDHDQRSPLMLAAATNLRSVLITYIRNGASVQETVGYIGDPARVAFSLECSYGSRLARYVEWLRWADSMTRDHLTQNAQTGKQLYETVTLARQRPALAKKYAAILLTSGADLGSMRAGTCVIPRVMQLVHESVDYEELTPFVDVFIAHLAARRDVESREMLDLLRATVLRRRFGEK